MQTIQALRCCGIFSGWADAFVPLPYALFFNPTAAVPACGYSRCAVYPKYCGDNRSLVFSRYSEHQPDPPTMQSHELEDLTLLLIHDTDAPPLWINRWAVSYPVVLQAQVARSQSIAEWQHTVQTAFAQNRSRHIAVVAHGEGVSAALAWLYQADVNVQKAVCNLILVSPLPEAFPDDAVHTLQRVRCHCRTALVIAERGDCCREWAQEKAALWNARLLFSPHDGRLNGALGGWQWGMKLMQEMLLS